METVCKHHKKPRNIDFFRLIWPFGATDALCLFTEKKFSETELKDLVFIVYHQKMSTLQTSLSWFGGASSPEEFNIYRWIKIEYHNQVSYDHRSHKFIVFQCIFITGNVTHFLGPSEPMIPPGWRACGSEKWKVSCLQNFSVNGKVPSEWVI